MKTTRPLILLFTALSGIIAFGQKVEPVKFGDFNNWVTRRIPESRILGGETKNVYAIGPTTTIVGDKPYNGGGGSPWATSNVMAKVAGITKTSNAVFPDTRDNGNKCARLTTVMESCKAAGLVNVNVIVAGSMFLGRMLEPVKSTKDPYSKMEMGIPFTSRPKAIQYDYKILIPEGQQRIYSSGFGKQKTVPGKDRAEVYIILQRRWEDADGNIYAKRVGTGLEDYSKTTDWVNGHRLNIEYGDITGSKGYTQAKGLIPDGKSYYARNSKGKMVPVHEVGWDSADATPTHLIMMFSAGSGEPYVGTPGQTMWVDNVAMVY